MPSKRKPPAHAGRRNPIAKALPRLGHRVKPSAKTYTRKGRSASRDRPFSLLGVGGDPIAGTPVRAVLPPP